jgi:hypothetical protein
MLYSETGEKIRNDGKPHGLACSGPEAVSSDGIGHKEVAVGITFKIIV